MMRTFTAQMRTNSNTCRRAGGFTFTELVIVVTMVSLFVLLAMMNLGNLLSSSSFESQAEEFVRAFRSAASAASESDRRYEIIIDFTEQSYTLREITTEDLSEVLEEEIILSNNFTERFRPAYVLFDDGDYTNDARALFRVGRNGFQYGGKVVLLDGQQNPYSVVINRLSRTVILRRGDVEIMTPKRPDELQF